MFFILSLIRLSRHVEWSYHQPNSTLSPHPEAESSAAYFPFPLSHQLNDAFQLSFQFSVVCDALHEFSYVLWMNVGRSNIRAIKFYFELFTFSCSYFNFIFSLFFSLSHLQLVKKKISYFLFVTIQNRYRHCVKQRGFLKTKLNECIEALNHNVRPDLYARTLLRKFIHNFSPLVVSRIYLNWINFHPHTCKTERAHLPHLLWSNKSNVISFDCPNRWVFWVEKFAIYIHDYDLDDMR